jgi:hypothetical protein
MYTRLEMGKVAGSRPAISSAARNSGTLFPKAAVLELPWLGDDVTPARWQDVWLSEGFANVHGMAVG